MTFGAKLAKLRKENNYTQEQLAELLGVTRQAVSRWESDAAYPETEKLIRLGRLFDCSMDYLLKDEMETPEAQPTQTVKLDLRDLGYERKSKRMVGNLPLWHINIGWGRTAVGIFALGLRARGICAVGVASVGVISVGAVSLGCLSFGALAVGLLALGAIAVGVIAAGAVGLGLFALGALAMGKFAVGALAVADIAALGDSARADIAVGYTEAIGSLYQTTGKLTAEDMKQLRVLLNENTPLWLAWAKELFLWLAG